MRECASVWRVHSKNSECSGAADAADAAATGSCRVGDRAGRSVTADHHLSDTD